MLGHDHQVFARRPRTLRQMLDGQADSTPDLPFLIAPERQWTYREAVEDIDAMAVLLSERYGVTAGDRVAIVAANHAEYAILMWATLTLGAIVTSLNGWWTGPELAYGIGLTGPRLIAGDERRLARLDGGIAPDGVPVRLLDELLAQAREMAGKAPGRGGHHRGLARRHLVHQRHDGPLQGRDPVAPQHHQLRHGQPAGRRVGREGGRRGGRPPGGNGDGVGGIWLPAAGRAPSCPARCSTSPAWSRC